MRHFLIVSGLALLALGLVWPWVFRLGSLLPFGRLPGDINISRPGFGVHNWLGTSILVSVVLTLILWVVRR